MLRVHRQDGNGDEVALIPPKRYDIFSPLCEMLRDAFRFFFKRLSTNLYTSRVSERFSWVRQNTPIFFWVRCCGWVAGTSNGYFCLGGTGFSANFSDKHLVPTSKYVRLGFLFSVDSEH